MNDNQGFVFDNSQTRLMNIDEALRFKIVEFLSNANRFRTEGDIVKAYVSVRGIFEILQPLDFKHKSLLIDYTKRINEYINGLGEKPIDARHRIIINERGFELRELVDDYFNLIPFCMSELGLHLKQLKNRDDPDEEFSQQTFNTDVSLLEGKKQLLKSLKSEDLIQFMSARQVHDVHARILVEVSLRKNREEVSNE